MPGDGQPFLSPDSTIDQTGNIGMSDINIFQFGKEFSAIKWQVDL